jgi:hypothetical protein
MSSQHEKARMRGIEKPEAIEVCDLNDDDDSSIDHRELSRRAVADATKAFEKFADELN